MIKRFVLLFAITGALVTQARADAGSDLFYALRKKVLTVKDYSAEVKMKINVSYLKIPQLRGTLIFKSPDKMRLERSGGISLLPKKNINLTISNLIPAGNVMVIDIGNVTIEGKKLHVLKVIPEDDLSNIVLTKIWIDETNLVAVRAETTTRNDGTVTMDLAFGKYASYGLPDKVTILLDLKDYKLPKGVTLDYNDEPTPVVKAAETDKKPKSKKGSIQINYLSYEINKGISDDRFK